jgi:Cdc6-like AAA superfamily ATPase
MDRRPKNLLLTGPPGCGKTTVIRRVVEQMKDRRLAGFYTQEIRQDGQRVGFAAVGLQSSFFQPEFSICTPRASGARRATRGVRETGRKASAGASRGGGGPKCVRSRCDSRTGIPFFSPDGG